MKSLDKIIETLIINDTLTDQPKLFYGMPGIAIFFFHYTRHTCNGLFQDYAFDLFGVIIEEIYHDNPVDYERSIAGIGTGIDYLIRDNYLEADDDIFNDLDQRMNRAVMYNL